MFARALLLASATCAAALASTAAFADPPIATRPGDAPPSASEAPIARLGEDPWGSVEADEQGDPRQAPPRIKGGCVQPPDRAPHGEVWVGASSRGYGDAGGVVSGPIGDCGSASLAIDVSGRR